MDNIGQGRPLSWDFVLEALTRAIPVEQIELVVERFTGECESLAWTGRS